MTFKILLLTYQAYHNTAPDYLCELITTYCSERNLRSNDMMRVRPCHPGPRLHDHVTLDLDLKRIEKSVFNLLDLRSGIIYICLFVKVLPLVFFAFYLSICAFIGIYVQSL